MSFIAWTIYTLHGNRQCFFLKLSTHSNIDTPFKPTNLHSYAHSYELIYIYYSSLFIFKSVLLVIEHIFIGAEIVFDLLKLVVKLVDWLFNRFRCGIPFFELNLEVYWCQKFSNKSLLVVAHRKLLLFLLLKKITR